MYQGWGAVYPALKCGGTQRQWPTFNYACANLFLTKKQWEQLAKERGKGKVAGGTRSTRREEETKVTVVSNYAEHSALSFDIGPVFDSGTVRTQPMRVAKLHRHIVVDASNSSNRDLASDPDPAVSDSSCSSSSDASDSSSCTISDASTSTATPTTGIGISSESPISVEPLAKKVRRRGIPSKPTVKVECIDVDDKSSSAPPATLLCESDHYPTDYVNR